MKLQSAIEYLSTYGWAILVLVVILGTLYYLGVFNPNTFSPKASPGSCYVYRPYGPNTTSFMALQGTCTNDIPEFVAYFNGQSSNVSGAGNALSPQAITITAWTDFSNLSQAQEILDTNWFAVNTGYEFDYYAAGIHFNFGNSAGYQNLGCSISLSTGKWNMLAVTYSAGNVVFYLNGAQLCTTSGANAIQYTLGGWRIGQLQGRYTYFNGLISNIQAYNASLGANDINALYIEGIGGNPIDLQNLVGWWPMNGNSNDYSGNNNNGTTTAVAFRATWYNSYSVP